MGFYLEKHGTNIWQGKFSLFSSPKIIHAVSTRWGGVSQPPYEQLNLALHVKDTEEKVLRNREIFCESLGVSLKRVCTCEQVHADKVFQVTAHEAGRGSLVYADAIPGTDALITDVPEILLMLFFADCTPLLFYDPVHQAIGAAHGGWKGTVKRIGVKTIQAMGTAFGTRPEDCLAAIGPAIGPCCYEIGSEVAEKFRQAFPAFHQQLLRKTSEGHWHLNLWRANRLQLEEAGVEPTHIDEADTCTACNSKMFFSYRADQGKTGRLAAAISLHNGENNKEEFS